MCSSAYHVIVAFHHIRCTVYMVTYEIALYRTQEESQVAVPEEQTWIDQQELQTQEVPEEDEQGEELPECVDHQPSSFERGKPRSTCDIP
jgi:hypothetical protein